MTAVNYDVRRFTKLHPYQIENNDSGAAKIMTGIIDFTRVLPIYSLTLQPASLLPGAQAGTLATDTIRVMKIPARSFVIGVAIKTATINGGTCTIEVGDSSGASIYATGANIAAALDTFSFNATTTPTNGVGKFYAADDYLLVTTNHTTNVAVVQFQVALVSLNLPSVPLIQ